MRLERVNERRERLARRQYRLGIQSVDAERERCQVLGARDERIRAQQHGRADICRRQARPGVARRTPPE
jgi:hypothetical protein